MAGVPWLADLLPAPESAAWPRVMSAPHPAAVGSYGREAEELAERELNLGNGRLRWWLRLALRMQLQHDAAGNLLVHEVVETTPRRSGKSVRLRIVALHRLTYADRWGEEQLVIHTGKDLNICKEIIRRAWPPVIEWGWKTRRTNGQEEIETPDGSRWAVRGRDSVYGYDTTLGMVDEAWGVGPDVVDDGLEPSLLERLQPQLMLTSTAHRRSSTLMPRRLAAAEAGKDPGILLLSWGATADDEPGDPNVWRAASPFWSGDRSAMLARKWSAALAGEVDGAADGEDDPVEAFRSQYLNVWPSAKDLLQLLVVPDVWASLRVGSFPPWSVVAVEAPPYGRPVVALAGRDDAGRAVVSVRRASTVADAVGMIGDARRVLVGKSLLGDPVWSSLPADVEKRQGTDSEAAAELRRLIGEDALRHDGGSVLGEEVTRTQVLAGRPERKWLAATKAAVWAATVARVAVAEPQVF